MQKTQNWMRVGMLIAVVGCSFVVPSADAQFTLLHSFTGGASDGSNPVGSLTICGSTLYGMTPLGGMYGEGNIFSIPVSGGACENLFDFDGFNGGVPIGSLTLNGSTLYGTTSFSGFGAGSIFCFDTHVGFQDLFEFGGLNHGTAPYGNLTLVNGVFYGHSSIIIG